MTKPDLILFGRPKQRLVEQMTAAFTVHPMTGPEDSGIAAVAGTVRAIAVLGYFTPVDATLMARLPQLKIVSSFGVGYDHIDAKWAGAHGIIVANTPDVVTEETADTALGLLLNTLREFPRAERFLRAGHWRNGSFPLSPTTLRDRRIGMVGLGRIGKAIARRIEGFGVPIAYHARHQQTDLAYRYCPTLLELARETDVLIVITPGGPATRHLINAEVLDALGRNGVLINVARGSVVDEAALIKALRDGHIHSVGLDVFADEPNVPQELLDMDRVVLLPHVGTATEYTRGLMDQLVIDNLLAFAAGKPPLTPVPETPWPPRNP